MNWEVNRSPEGLTPEERHAKIAAFISEVIRPAHNLLIENEKQLNAVYDFESRDYQLQAWDALWQARTEGSDRGLIHLATGLGKTSVAVFDYARFRSERIKEGESARGLFVVHQNNILDQARRRFSEVLPDIRTTRSSDDLNDPSVDMAFVSFQALRRRIDRLDEDAFDYIVYDEAHHIEAATYKKVVEHFKPAFQLGLTATPERMDDKDITAHFGDALYSKTLPEAIAEGHLATVSYNIVYDDAVAEAMTSDFTPSTIAEIQRLFDVEPRNEVIAEKIREAQEQIRREQGVEQVKTIVFCSDVEHADTIAKMMNGQSYHSGKDTKRQQAILSSFRTNGLETITVRDMFNEGVDVPDARLIVFLRTTQSPTVFEQQLGRGLRRNDAKQEVTVLDFVANVDRISLIRQLADSVNDAKGPRGSGTPGDGNGASGDVIEITGGLKVHNDKSEFIFSQEMINLLEKYNMLSGAAPDGWLTYQQAGELLGIRHDAVRNRLGTLGLAGDYFKGQRGAPTLYISPETFAALEALTTDMPEGYISVIEAAERLNLTNVTTMKRLEKLGLEVTTCRLHEGYLLTIIPEAYVEQLQAYSTVPDGFMSFPELADMLGWEWGTVKKRAEELGLQVHQYVVHETGKLTSFLSPDAIRTLEQYGVIPDGYVSLQDAASEFGVSVASVRTRLEYLGLSTEVFPHTSKGKPPHFISAEDMEAVRAYSQVDTDRLINFDAAADELGVVRVTLKKHVAALGIAFVCQLGPTDWAPTFVLRFNEPLTYRFTAEEQSKPANWLPPLFKKTWRGMADTRFVRLERIAGSGNETQLVFYYHYGLKQEQLKKEFTAYVRGTAEELLKANGLSESEAYWRSSAQLEIVTSAAEAPQPA